MSLVLKPSSTFWEDVEAWMVVIIPVSMPKDLWRTRAMGARQLV
jgi:hypothetical protein